MENRLTAWFEIIGLSAVVISLVFVGLQMQQQRNLTRATLGAEGMQASQRVAQAISRQDVALAWAKMLNKAEELSPDEIVQVNSVLSMAKYLFMRECYLKEMEVFEECGYILRDQAPMYFSSPYAQSWWGKNKPPPGFGTVEIDSAISRLAKE